MNERCDFKSLVAKGQVVLNHWSEVYLDTEGKFVAETVLGKLLKMHDKAIAEGFSGLRTCGEMATIFAIAGAEALVKYEVIVNKGLQDAVESGRHVVSMCQYDLRTLPSLALLDLLTVHPYSCFQEVAIQNIYYVPPDEYFSELLSDHILSRRLKNLSDFHELKSQLFDREEKLTQANRNLQQAHRWKDEFLGAINHELRSPLSAVLMSADILKDTQLDFNQRDLVDAISVCGSHLLNLINDVLDLQKIGEGKLDLEEAPFDLVRCCIDSITIARMRDPQKNIEVAYELCDLPPKVLGDAIRSQQILVNLLTNAVKFTHKGYVKLRASRITDDSSDDHVNILFEVIDTGIGIPPDKISTIFSRFSQVDASITRRFGGSGLGLAISSELVLKMHSMLQVKSSLGEGSSFSFMVRLPLATSASDPSTTISGTVRSPVRQPALPAATKQTEQEQVAKSIQPCEKPSSQHTDSSIPLSILIVEDNPVNQKLQLRIMSKLGFECDLASDGQEAVDAWQKKDYDLIFMDLCMPRLSGLEATSQIRSLHAHSGQKRRRPHIVAMTAHALESMQKQALDNGFNEFITKPFQMAKVRKVVEDCYKVKAAVETGTPV